MHKNINNLFQPLSGYHVISNNQRMRDTELITTSILTQTKIVIDITSRYYQLLSSDQHLKSKISTQNLHNQYQVPEKGVVNSKRQGRTSYGLMLQRPFFNTDTLNDGN